MNAKKNLAAWKRKNQKIVQRISIKCQYWNGQNFESNQIYIFDNNSKYIIIQPHFVNKYLHQDTLFLWWYPVDICCHTIIWFYIFWQIRKLTNFPKRSTLSIVWLINWCMFNATFGYFCGSRGYPSARRSIYISEL